MTEDESQAGGGGAGLWLRVSGTWLAAMVGAARRGGGGAGAHGGGRGGGRGGAEAGPAAGGARCGDALRGGIVPGGCPCLG